VSRATDEAARSRSSVLPHCNVPLAKEVLRVFMHGSCGVEGEAKWDVVERWGDDVHESMGTYSLALTSISLQLRPESFRLLKAGDDFLLLRTEHIVEFAIFRESVKPGRHEPVY
jgi:hypothetical protein